MEARSSLAHGRVPATLDGNNDYRTPEGEFVAHRFEDGSIGKKADKQGREVFLAAALTADPGSELQLKVLALLMLEEENERRRLEIQAERLAQRRALFGPLKST